MQMKTRFSTAVALSFLAFFCAMLSFVADVAWAYQDQPGTISLKYEYDGTALADTTVRLYKTDLSPDGDNKKINDEELKKEKAIWDRYIRNPDVTAIAVGVTDKSGLVCFSGLQSGVYLAGRVMGIADGIECLFDSVMIILPQATDEGILNYDIFSCPKGEKITVKPEETTENENESTTGNEGGKTPGTGDDSDGFIWIIMGFMAMAVIAAVWADTAIKQKNKRK